MTGTGRNQEEPLPDLEHCNARRLAGLCDVVDCLVANPLCGHAISFGYGFLCQHPRRKEIVELIEARLAAGTDSSAGNPRAEQVTRRVTRRRRRS